MSARTYVDTNVFVFLNDGRPSSEALQAAAAAWLEEECRSGMPTVSLNVLGETYVNLVRRRGEENLPLLSPEAAEAAVEDLLALNVVVPDAAVYRAALRHARQHRRGFWDSLHLAAAKAAGCQRIATDDVPTPAVLDGIAYVNPFEGVERSQEQTKKPPRTRKARPGRS